jgi:hypothetical protein
LENEEVKSLSKYEEYTQLENEVKSLSETPKPDKHKGRFTNTFDSYTKLIHKPLGSDAEDDGLKKAEGALRTEAGLRLERMQTAVAEKNTAVEEKKKAYAMSFDIAIDAKVNAKAAEQAQEEKSKAVTEATDLRHEKLKTELEAEYIKKEATAAQKHKSEQDAKVENLMLANAHLDERIQLLGIEIERQQRTASETNALHKAELAAAVKRAYEAEARAAIAERELADIREKTPEREDSPVQNVALQAADGGLGAPRDLPAIAKKASQAPWPLDA